MLSEDELFKLSNIYSNMAILDKFILESNANIEDIIIIGTQKSKESISLILEKNQNIEMIVIESSNVEDVFQKSLEYMTKDTILDLTQGYRHYPMLTLLASVFLQNSKTKNIKDIFYAQIVDEECKPYEKRDSNYSKFN